MIVRLYPIRLHPELHPNLKAESAQTLALAPSRCLLKRGQHIEVVCPLDHPTTEQTPWDKAVSKKAQEGGGWLTWVFAPEDVSKVQEKFGLSAIEGHRTLPDGSDLKWKQIGVNKTSDLWLRCQMYSKTICQLQPGARFEQNSWIGP